MKISVYIATTMDGFIAREDGSLDWLPGSDGQTDPQMGDEDYGFYSFFNSVDVLVMGRNTFQLVYGFDEWPYEDKRVFVLSTSLDKLPEDLPDTVALRNCAPPELLKELKGSGARHVYVDGGRTIQGFLDADLIDEITITRIPVLIGSGIPLFGPLHHDIELTHLGTRSYTNGFVQSRYRILKQAINDPT
jgi:dihydrofolate reductase